MIGIVRPQAGGFVRIGADLCGVLMIRQGDSMAAPDAQLTDAQSRQIAATIREELARRRISRQQLAEQAKLSISTLEKALGGRRPFTLATTVRLEQALGVSLRKGSEETANGDVAPDSLGAYSRRAVTWMEGTYVTVRPSFSEPDAIYAYCTEIVWDAKASCLTFREGERVDAAFAQHGEVAVPNQSGHIYLVTIRDGQHRLITVSRPTIQGAMYGIIATLRAGRGSQLTPVAAPIAYLPIRNIASPRFGRIMPGETNHELYRAELRRTMDEPFALFIGG
jgi:transcriptional regulator with XRE-family HTH domain